jgi:hypothetical protein
MTFINILTESILSDALEETAAEVTGEISVPMALSLSCSIGLHDVEEVVKHSIGFSQEAKKRFLYDLKASVISKINSTVPGTAK